MSIRKTNEIFPCVSGAAERDPAFRSVLANLLHTGLRQCGAIGLAGTLLYLGLSVWGLGYDLHWSYRAFQEGSRGSQVVMIALLIVSALSVFGLVLAQMECSLRSGRLFGLGAILLTTAVVAFEGALRDTFTTEYVMSAFLLIVAIIPFWPPHVLGIGIAIGLVFLVLGPSGLVWEGSPLPSSPMARHLAFIGGASILISGVSAALYRRHRAFAQSQTELQKNRDLLRRTQKVGQVGGWEYLTGPEHVRGTDWFWKFLGHSAEKTEELDQWLRLFGPDARQKVRQSMEHCVKNGDSFDVEVPIETGDGNKKWSRVRGEACAQNGQVKRVSGTLQNITGQKERQQELVEAKEEAERMNRLKSAFLANVSHEIRTPLTSILGFAEAIGEEVEPDEKDTILKFSRLIRKSGHRLMETLNAVLNLSKLEAGEMDLSIETLDLTSEAEAAAEQLRAQAEEKGICLQVESQAPVRTQADEGALQIILVNLLSNAVKYTESGGKVWVWTYLKKGVPTLEVEDTGIGMDPNRTKKLFQPFQQESKGMSRKYEGTGLGLAVTKKAVDQMNGSIAVETEKGEGTCFTVQLPKESSENQLTSSQPEAPSSSGTEQAA